MQNKYVLDTNIWVSNIISSKLAKLSAYIIPNGFTISLCDELINEIKDVLTRPHIEKYINLPVSEIIIAIERIGKKVTISRHTKKLPTLKIITCTTCV